MLSVFGLNKKERAEKVRLEAFLSATPYEYCGWTNSDHVAYSPGFLNLFGLDGLSDETQLYASLTPSDAAALEGQLTDLRQGGTSFVLEVQTEAKNKTLKITGQRGHALNGEFVYDVIWVEDVTQLYQNLMEAKQSRDAAEAGEELYKSLLDQIDMPIWLQDKEGKLEWVNAHYTQSLDLSLNDIIEAQKYLPVSGKKKSDVGHKTIQKAGQEALKSGEKTVQQNHFILSGQRRLMDLHFMPTKGKEKVVGYGVDITKREEITADWDRYKETNDALLQQLHTAIAAFDADTRLEFYNAEFARLWDLEDQWLNLCPKLSEVMESLRENRRLPEQADFKAFKQTWLDMFHTLIDPFEDMMHLPDGRTLRLLFMPKPSGGLIMMFEDVSSELELKSSYNTLVAVQKETLDNLSEAVAVYGGDGRLKLWNPSYANIWQFSPELLDNSPHVSKLVDKKRDFFDADSWEETRELFLKLRLERAEYEGRFERIDGIILDYATIPLPDGGVLITYVDVSDRVRVQHALEEKNVALEEAERLKLDFLANVSYQLRTPLNAIMGFADILSNQYFGELNERQSEYTLGISDAGDRLLNLIDDILDLATLEAGYMNLHADTVEVYAMVKHIYTLTQEWARKEAIKVAFKCDQEIGVIIADERRLKQVLLGLIRNAITFTPEGGKIKLQAERLKDKNMVRLCVSDTGPGISDEDQARLFKPFEKSGNKNEGAGLGLSLVKNIVELHGGYMELESELDKGTTFHIYLPNEAKSTVEAA